jgi:hypothetical protein
MKLALLIVVAGAIVVGAAASYFYYQAWRDNRFDDLIVESAKRHDVDPALVKALIMAQADLNYAALVPQARGMMLVPPDVAEAYLRVHGRDKWRYICVNRRFRNHDPTKPEQFTADEPGRCKAPGCGQPLVEELLDPATNIEVGCWYLGRLNASLRAAWHGPVPPNVLVAMYRWVPIEEAPTFDPRTFKATAEQAALLTAFTKAYDKYAPRFEKRARQAEAP